MVDNRDTIPYVFFLGAGASVMAGVHTTRKFVEEFKNDLEKHHDGKLPPKYMPFFTALKEPHDDLEALLELLHQHSELDYKPIARTVDRKKNVESASAEELTQLLENFLHKTCYVDKNNINYLEPLSPFISLAKSGGRALDVFTVNYDTSIEVFCLTKGFEFNNGFKRKWTPEGLDKEDKGIDIKLYKLHGSATWWLTDEGHLVEIPMAMDAERITTYYGSKAQSLIVYPYDPRKKVPISTLDLLPMLRKRLEKTELVIIVGYSFRDVDIKEIFFDAARKNSDLKVILIGPEAYKIYRTELYSLRGNAPSPLRGRVLCLPFLFENVFRYLREDHYYLYNAGWSQYEHNRGNEKFDREVTFNAQLWKEPLKNLSRSGDFDKVVEIITRAPLKNWEFKTILDVAPVTYMMATLCNSEKEPEIRKWIDWLINEIVNSVNGLKLEPKQLLNDGIWAEGLRVYFPNLGELTASELLKKELFNQTAKLKHLTNMANESDVSQIAKKIIFFIESMASYFEERWPGHDYIPVIKVVEDGYKRDAENWKQFYTSFNKNQISFQHEILRQLEDLEKKTFSKHINNIRPWKFADNDSNG